MTEREWSESTDPKALLTHLRKSTRVGDDALRGFACACCRLAEKHLALSWPVLPIAPCPASWAAQCAVSTTDMTWIGRLKRSERLLICCVLRLVHSRGRRCRRHARCGLRPMTRRKERNESEAKPPGSARCARRLRGRGRGCVARCAAGVGHLQGELR